MFIEKRIKEWKRNLRRNSALEDGYIKELESHLRDEIDKGLDEGKGEEEAFNEAVLKIGMIENVGDEYYKSDTTHISKRPPWQMPKWIPAMVYNHFKITMRIFKRQKGYSLINILGLSIGMAACLLIFQYIVFEKSFDTFHKDYKNIYRVLNYRYYNNGLDISAGCTSKVGPTIKEEFPEVLTFTRMRKIEPTVNYHNTIFKEDNTLWADSSFFSIFTFPLKAGNPLTALKKPFSAVLTESTAKKYFGNEDPIGKTITLWNSEPYTITGIAKDLPVNSYIQFDLILSFSSQYGENFCEECNDNNTFIKVKEGTDAPLLQSKFSSIIDKIHGENQNTFEREYTLQPLDEIHLYSTVRFELSPTGNGEAINILSLIAIFILIIAWLNYINLSTARSIKRAKEAALRKVVGAGRINLIKQFLLESFTLNILAVITAFIIVFVVFGAFLQLIEKDISFTLLNNPFFLVVLFLSIVFGSLLSGIYPAFIMSSYSPVDVFKDKITGKGKAAVLRKGLIIFQFAIAVALIASTLTVYKQIAFMRNKNLGINLEQTVAVNWATNFPDDFDYYGHMDAFIEDLSNKSSIKGITYSSIYPGVENGNVSGGIRPQMALPEEGEQIYSVWIANNFLDFFNIPLLCGRNFLESDLTNLFESLNENKGILINETACKIFGFNKPEDALGVNIVIDDKPAGRVIGVIKDYHQQSLDKDILPTIFYGVKWGRYFILKIDSQNIDKTLETIKAKFNGYYPGNAFIYSFLDEVFDNQYKADIQFGKVFGLFAAFAIFIACLGLLGLVSFTTVQRTKEIGIRKTLGASVINIVLLIANEFFLLILVSIIIALPFAYYLMNLWLENFAFRSSINWRFFVLPIIVILLVASIAVGFNILKAAVANPVNSLKYE